MDFNIFLDKCKGIVTEYTNEHLDKSDKKEISVADVFVVWYCKTLKNAKALLSTTLLTVCTMKLHITAKKKSYIWMLTRSLKIDV